MKSIIIKSLVAVLALFVFPMTGALAQTVPNLINYQGKLTDASANPLPNGTYGVAFRIWSKKASTEAGDQLIWGQEYNVAVVSGIFNVILGAPGGTPIPGAAVNDLGFAFGESNRFFGLTVTRGTNGVTIPGATEIVPRQQILSAPFSIKAELANNVTDAAITTSKLADGAVTSSKLTSGAVTSDKLTAGSVTTEKVDQAAITTEKLLDGSVTRSKLSTRVVGVTVPVGGLARSASSGTFSGPENSPSWADVPNLSVTISTSGRPVFVGLVPDGSTTGNPTGDSDGSHLGISTTSKSYVRSWVRFLRNGTAISEAALTATNIVRLHVPPSAMQVIDLPSAGQHTYTVQVWGAQNTRVWRVVLLAYEL